MSTPKSEKSWFNVDEFRHKVDQFILQTSSGHAAWFVAIVFLVLTFILLPWMGFYQQDPTKLKTIQWGLVAIFLVIGLVLLIWIIVEFHSKREWRRWMRYVIVALLLSVALVWPIGCFVGSFFGFSFGFSLCSRPKEFLSAIGGLQNVITASAGVASILAFLQVLWIRRRFEFQQYSPVDFLREICSILDSVDHLSLKGADRRKGDVEYQGADRRIDDFYYLCMVHDPAFPTLLGQSSWVPAFCKKFYDVMNNSDFKKHIAILKPGCTKPKTDTGLPYTWDDQNELLVFEREWAFDNWELDTPAQERVKQYFSNLRNGYPENYDGSVFDQIIKGRARIDGHGEDKVKRFIELSASVFHRLFYHGRQRCDKGDSDVAVYPLKKTHFTVAGTGSDGKYAYVNIICSRTRGLIAFFEMFSETQYTLHALPISNDKFVRILPKFFDRLVKDESSEESDPVYLKKQPEKPEDARA